VPRREGFTLVEITVALALTLIVTGAVYRLLFASQRLSRAQAAQLSLQTNVRTGSIVAASELRALGAVPGGSPAQNDIISIGSSGMTYRAARGMGFLCQPPAAINQFRIARSSFSGYRDPQPARDVAYVFSEGSPNTDVDDSWLALPISEVVTGSACPGAMGAGITLSTSAAAPTDAPAGTPVRVYEVMELRSYLSEGRWWLGARSVGAGEVIQPIAGPLADRDGFHLEYRDLAGAETTEPTAIRSIRIRIHTVAEDSLSSWNGSRMEEELTTGVTLRNGPRR
jgi:prepilin-type N-terminal cleavage/methylation domain-containing protein